MERMTIFLEKSTVINVLITIILISLCFTTSNGNQDADKAVTGKRTPLEMYRKLFEENRKIQIEAVKSLQQFGDNTQRYKLVNMMLTQLMSVLAEGRTNLTEWGYVPGDPFPENETIKETVSKVLENTAMFGDMVLRLPDIVHDIYDRNKEWQIVISWGVWFCNESSVFQGPAYTLLNLNAKDTNKDGTTKKSKAQKKKKEKRKGPRLSGGGHTEL